MEIWKHIVDEIREKYSWLIFLKFFKNLRGILLSFYPDYDGVFTNGVSSCRTRIYKYLTFTHSCWKLVPYERPRAYSQFWSPYWMSNWLIRALLYGHSQM